jgi:hypothetical protein
VVVVVLVDSDDVAGLGRSRYTVHALQFCQHPTLLAEGRPAGEVSNIVNVTQENADPLQINVSSFA